MNILFTTQSGSLSLFADLAREMAGQTDIGQVGFTVADRWSYHQWSKNHPDFESDEQILVKEWEVTSERRGRPDLDRLAHYENMLAGPSGAGPGLFGAIVADRRLLMGPNCTYFQDYRRRFTDDELLRILQNGCVAIEKAFDRINPDLVVGFICVSILEYLAFLFARTRGIRYLNLRTARISNRIMMSDSHRDPAPEVAASFFSIETEQNPDYAVARRLITQTRDHHAKYEGVTAPSHKPARKVSLPRNALSAPVRFMRNIAEYNACGAADDNHCPGLVRPLLFKALFNPVRARQVDRKLRPNYIIPEELTNRRYAVFPLHTEPEISLLLYGRPFLNQIEIIRALALSLPADMILIIKEHPWMVGKRSMGSYRKFLNIPRVHFAAPEMDLRDLITKATLVTLLTGSSGIEAAVLEKPVLTLGPSMVDLLPDHMVTRCRDLTLLPEVIATLLSEHRHDEAALERLFAAIDRNTVEVNLYSGLLGRVAGFTPEERRRDDDLARLASFAIRRAAQPAADVPANVEVGSW